MKKKRIHLFTLFCSYLLISTSLISCKKDSPTFQLPKNQVFYCGADMSWITEQENNNIFFYTIEGEKEDAMVLLKSKGISLLRLRVFVNPIDGYCNKEDVVQKALRAKALGIATFIDFHYSDSWADPGKQNIPKAWLNMSLSTMKEAIKLHTQDVLVALKNKGIIPIYIQIGNEISNGMLWPIGKANENASTFAQLFNTGKKAALAIFPKTKIIVHLDRGEELTHLTWLLDLLQQNGASWDVIGLSLYPTINNYKNSVEAIYQNIHFLKQRYNSPSLIVEVGMPNNAVQECYHFLTYLLQQMRLPNTPCEGILYWEPQAYNNWKGYGKGAFTDEGKPSIVLDVFQ